MNYSRSNGLLTLELDEDDFKELIMNEGGALYKELENLTYAHHFQILYVPSRLLAMGLHTFKTGKHYKSISRLLSPSFVVYPDVSD